MKIIKTKNKIMEFIIKIGIQATDKEKAGEVVSNLLEIYNALNDADLEDLAKLLKENPGIVQTAKNYLGKK
jgi:uncharacterized protein YjgD (DUF1641 family)